MILLKKKRIFAIFEKKSAPVTLKIGQGYPLSISFEPIMRCICVQLYWNSIKFKDFRVFTTKVDAVCSVTFGLE